MLVQFFRPGLSAQVGGPDFYSVLLNLKFHHIIDPCVFLCVCYCLPVCFSIKKEKKVYCAIVNSMDIYVVNINIFGTKRRMITV